MSTTTIYQRRIRRRLQALITDHQWSQLRLSAALGLCQSSLSRFLSGESSIGIETLVKLSQTCGGSVGEWLQPNDKIWRTAVDNYASRHKLSFVDRRRSRSAQAEGTHCPASLGHVQRSDESLTTTE